MTNFHSHVVARLRGLLQKPKSTPAAGELSWTAAAVSVRVLGRSSDYLANRIGGALPLRVGDVDRVLAALREAGLRGDAGLLLDGEPMEQGFADTCYGRLFARMQLADLDPVDLPGLGLPQITRRAWASGRGLLTCDAIDAVLSHLRLPVSAMLAPALGPYDARLLGVLALRPTPATRHEIEAVLAGYRGAPMPSRPVGSRAGGAMVARSGCGLAVRRMVEQGLLEPVDAVYVPGKAIAARTPLRVTTAGRKAAGIDSSTPAVSAIPHHGA